MRISKKILLISLLCVLFISGCSPAGGSRSAKRSADGMGGPIQIDDRLKLMRVAGDTPSLIPDSIAPRDVYVIVHPAYSVFFRDASKEKYSDIKNALLNEQFHNETKMILSRASAGSSVILVLPGKYATESQNPQGYISYLNSEFGDNKNIYYVLSENTSSGTLNMSEMVHLYVFLQALKVNQSRVMIGGGYIGRCQREFYTQLTTYLDRSVTYIVPEMSTISPEDITDSEAMAILGSLMQQNFTPVKQFIDKKTHGSANVSSIP